MRPKENKDAEIQLLGWAYDMVRCTPENLRNISQVIRGPSFDAPWLGGLFSKGRLLFSWLMLEGSMLGGKQLVSSVF